MLFVKEPKIFCLQKYKPVFKTIDNIIHDGTNKWIDPGCISNIPEYLMIEIKSKGYIKDDKNVMYPLENILSIEWKLIKEKKFLDDFCHRYQILFDDEEVKEMKEYKE